MKKKAVSMLLAASMVATMFAGCGSNGSSNTSSNSGSSSSASGTEAAEVEVADAVDAAADEGKVINIYSWNDEAKTRICAVYDRVVETSEDNVI